MKNSPLCTVCIPNYNGEQYIAKCIDSVVSQKDFPGEIEIIVHDDASTDRSVEVIRTRYPQVRLLPSEENVGFCVSNNRMVAAAQGEFILLLNNDAVLYPDALKTLLAESMDSGVGIYGLPQYNAATGELIDLGSLFDPFLNPFPNRDHRRSDVGMVIGACLFLPKNLWDELGGFPEWFGSLAEDMLLCCQARLRSLPVRVVNHSGFDHSVGKSFGGGKVLRGRLSTTLSRRAKSERNKTFVMLICYPLLAVTLLVPLHISLLVAEGLMLSAIKRDRRILLEVYWFSLREIWEKRQLWLRKRRLVQGSRSCSLSDFFAVFTGMPHKLRMLLRYGIPEVR